MAVLGWVMIALAIWHFTIFLPDNFWAGIIGAFVFAIFGGVIGAMLISLVVESTLVPPMDVTNIGTILYAIPGTAVGLGLCYLIGLRRPLEPLE